MQQTFKEEITKNSIKIIESIGEVSLVAEQRNRALKYAEGGLKIMKILKSKYQ